MEILNDGQKPGITLKNQIRKWQLRRNILTAPDCGGACAKELSFTMERK